jgi:uncharacterized protein (DUF4415 family)
MNASRKDTPPNWVDPDDAPEWPDEVFDSAEISRAGEIVRVASGTLTRRGRPPVGSEPKQQVTLRLPRHVVDHFKADGAGWQTRISDLLEDHAAKAGVDR